MNVCVSVCVRADCVRVRSLTSSVSATQRKVATVETNTTTNTYVKVTKDFYKIPITIFPIWYDLFSMLLYVYARPIRMSCHIITMAATGLTCSVSLKSIFVLFGSVIFLLGQISCNEANVHRRFEYKYSFKPPYLAQKDGTVPFWEYGGSKYSEFSVPFLCVQMV